MLELLLKLFTYDAWSNRRVLDSLTGVEDPNERPLRLLSHILAAEHNWLCRAQGNTRDLRNFFPLHTLAECRAQAEDLAQRWPAYLKANKERLDAPIVYTTTEGQTYEAQIEDIVLHVVNHSTHHRGQIATAVRAAGGAPAVTDYIAQARKPA